MGEQKSKVAWGILGPGGIAHTFARGLAGSRTGKLVAVGSRTQESADAFAKEFGLKRAHGSYEALLADPAMQAVYISTPHPSHAEWCVKAARARKHILCEKPLTMNHAEAMAVAEAAREHDVFLMEAFMYRCHPQMARLVELIRSGAIGQVGVIQATFSFHPDYNAESRLFKNELGGGGILDVGCYAASIARLIAGAAQGLPFANPEKITGYARLHPEAGTDLYAVASVQFPGGILGQLAAGVGLKQDNGVRVFGSEGSLHLPTPNGPPGIGGATTIFLTRKGSAVSEEIVIESKRDLYALEADSVGDALAQGRLESPYMTVADTLGNMAALDAWRASAGLVYESEKPSFPFPTVSRETLRRRPDAPMRYGRIAGVEPPVSRLVLGCDNQQTMPDGAVIFDDFFERGGNAFDTAYVYGNGKQELLLGHWMRRRDLRSQVVLTVKGAHTPLCTPEHLDRQLRESLERLQTDYADIYLMHRDNLKVPVGEFVDLLNEHHRAGRIKAFGGSNWTLGRLQEAAAYAAKKNLQKFTCVSNNFSLARMVAPPWDGCMAATDPAFKQWMTASGISLLAWSSQARGFFADRAHPGKKENAELVRCWSSDDNFERRERAVELARRKGVQPINIALAYVLGQPFSTFALIGPRRISEIVGTFRALSVTLTPEEIKWLNLDA
ncbi:MAG: aldo/keto reductase [Methylacidiphilales bacterium]|nr:aldo/keto reductase [Candidatus Methylacidiphilales bacterium]